jgi:hypothetical protein
MNKCSVQYRFIFLIASGTYTQLNICTKTILYKVQCKSKINFNLTTNVNVSLTIEQVTL